MVGLGGSFSSPSQGFALSDAIRFRTRLNLIEQVAPDFAAGSPEYAASLAGSYTSDDDLVSGVLGAVGATGIEQLIAELQDSDPDYARASFNLMPEAQQRILMQAGYEPPAPKESKSWFSKLNSPFTLPFTSPIKKLVQTVIPGVDVTGGNISLGGYSGGKLGDIANAAVTGLGLPARFLGAGLKGLLHGMDAMWRLETRLYRTGYDLQQRAGIPRLGPLQGVFGPVVGFLANPTELSKAWHDVSDGEEYHTRSSRIEAERQLAGVQSDFTREILLKIASKRSANHSLAEVVSQIFPDLIVDSPEFSQMVTDIAHLESQESFMQAISTLDKGNVSFGRELVRGFGLSPENPIGKVGSGLADAALMIFGDPTNLLGSQIVKSRKLYGLAVHSKGRQGEMKLLATVARKVRAYDAAVAAGDSVAINEAAQAASGAIQSHVEHVLMNKHKHAGRLRQLAAKSGLKIHPMTAEKAAKKSQGATMLLRNRKTWEEARAFNNWVDMTAEAVLHRELGVAARKQGLLDEAMEHELLVAAYFKESPQTDQAWDAIIAEHIARKGKRTPRIDNADLAMLDEFGEGRWVEFHDMPGLDTYEGLLEFMEQDAGMKLVQMTSLGGFMTEARMLPGVAPALALDNLGDVPFHLRKRAVRLLKTKFSDFFDNPATDENFHELFDYYSEISKAVKEGAESGTFELDGEFLEEVAAYVEKQPKRKIRKFIRSGFYHQPHRNVLNQGRPENLQEFKRMIEGGALAGMPRNIRDQMLALYASGTDADRILLVEQFVADFFLRSGLISSGDEAAQRFLGRFVGRLHQSYSMGGLDEMAIRGHHTRATLKPDSDQMSEIVAIPDFKELLKMSRKLNTHRALFGGRVIHPNSIDTMVTKVWAPAQLLRPGFIVRASGEMLLHYILRRPPGEYARALSQMRSTGVRIGRKGKLVVTDIDAFAKHSRFSSEFIHANFEEWRELTILRPILWMGHQIGEWSRLVGAEFEHDVLDLAQQLASRGARQNVIWKELAFDVQENYINEAMGMLRKGKPIRSKLVDTYEWAERMSLQAGSKLHEIAQNRGFLTKREIYEKLNEQMSLRLSDDDILSKLFETEHELGTHVAHLTLNDAIISRAVLEQQGVFNPHFTQFGVPLEGRLADDFTPSLQAQSKARYIQVRIDPSNQIPYMKRDDLPQMTHNWGLMLTNSQTSPSTMAQYEALNHYVSFDDFDNLKAFLVGHVPRNQSTPLIDRLIDSPDPVAALRDLRKSLRESGAIGLWRNFLRDPTDNNYRALMKRLESPLHRYTTEVVREVTTIPARTTQLDEVDRFFDEPVLYAHETFTDEDGVEWVVDALDTKVSRKDIGALKRDSGAMNALYLNNMSPAEAAPYIPDVRRAREEGRRMAQARLADLENDIGVLGTTLGSPPPAAHIRGLRASKRAGTPVDDKWEFMVDLDETFVRQMRAHGFLKPATKHADDPQGVGVQQLDEIIENVKRLGLVADDADDAEALGVWMFRVQAWMDANAIAKGKRPRWGNVNYVLNDLYLGDALDLDEVWDLSNAQFAAEWALADTAYRRAHGELPRVRTGEELEWTMGGWREVTVGPDHPTEDLVELVYTRRKEEDTSGELAAIMRALVEKRKEQGFGSIPSMLELLFDSRIDDDMLTMSFNDVKEQALSWAYNQMFRFSEASALRGSLHANADVGATIITAVPEGHTRLYMPSLNRHHQKLLGEISGMPPIAKSEKTKRLVKSLFKVVNESGLAEEVGVREADIVYELLQGTQITASDIQRIARSDYIPTRIATSNPAFARTMNNMMAEALDEWARTVGVLLPQPTVRNVPGSTSNIAGVGIAPSHKSAGALVYVDVPDDHLKVASGGRRGWGKDMGRVDELLPTDLDAAIEEGARGAILLDRPNRAIIANGEVGMNQLGDSEFFAVEPRVSIGAQVIRDEEAEWIQMARITARDTGNVHYLTASPDEIARMEREDKNLVIEVLDSFWAAGTTEEKAIQQLVAKQFEEVLYEATTMRNAESGVDRVLREITGPMLRGETMTDELLYRVPHDDMPHMVYGPKVLKPSELGKARIVQALQGMTRAGFDDVLSPAINAIIYKPQLHVAFVEAYRDAMPRFLESEPFSNLNMLHAQDGGDIRTVWGAPWAANHPDFERIINTLTPEGSPPPDLNVMWEPLQAFWDEMVGVDADIDEMQRAVLRLLEHDLVAHQEGVVSAASGFDLVPIIDNPAADRLSAVARALKKDSEIPDHEFFARWVDYVNEGKVYRIKDTHGTWSETTLGQAIRDYVYELQYSLTELIPEWERRAGMSLEEGIKYAGYLGSKAAEDDLAVIRGIRDLANTFSGTGKHFRSNIRRARVHYDTMRTDMIQGAITRFVPFIDDHRVRSQFQSHVGGLIPFWFAEEQFLKRWARGFYETPHQFRKGQIMMNGLRNMGFIDTDEYGNEVFVYPMSPIASQAIGAFAQPLFGGMGAGQVITGPLSTNVQYMFPGLNETPGQFGWGPWGVVLANTIADFFPEFGAARDELLGDLGANRWDPGVGSVDATIDTLMPSSVGRLMRAITRKFDPSELASAQIQALQVLAASEGLPPANATAEDMDNFLHRARNMARTILGIRGLTGFFGGSTGNPSFKGIEFREDFRELLEAGLEYPEALEVLQTRAQESDYEFEVSPFTVFTTRSTSGAPIPSTVAALEYMESNKQFIKNYRDLAPWFLPQGKEDFGIRQRRARNTALADELRIRRTPEEFLRALYVAEAAEDFFQTDDDYQLKIARSLDLPLEKKSLEQEHKIWKSGYLAAHPVFAEEISTRVGAARRERIVDQARLLLADWDQVPSSPNKDSMEIMLAALVAFNDRMDSLKLINATEATNLRRVYRREFYNAAEAAAATNPELSTFFNSIVRPMIGSNNVLLYEAGL